MKNNSTYAVILAGGAGTRFWPLSRELAPKQFLSLNGNKSLLQQTIKRILPIIPSKNIFIIGNCLHNFEIKRQIANYAIPEANIILEPEGKNTAPAIGLAARFTLLKDPEAIMFVFPSDHYISNEKGFLRILKQAQEIAEQDCLVTLGIQPTMPHTGYGYIKIRNQKPCLSGRQAVTSNQNVYEVEKFIEKPDLEKAKKFIKAKHYYWNSGMFVWKAKVILEEIRTYLPDLSKGLRELGNCSICSCSIYGAKLIKQPTFRRIWNQIEAISIDYGILEKSKRAAVVVAKNIGWSDLGSWSSLTEILPKDKNGNVIRADSIDIGSKNIAVFGNLRLVATIGLKDLIISDTQGALLVCDYSRAEEVKEIVRILNRNGRCESKVNKDKHYK